MELTIDIPKGYIVDRENSTDTCIKLKKVEKPTSWEEYSSTKKRMEIYFTNSQGEVLHSYINDGRKPLDFDTKEELSAILSFGKLIQLRKAWVEEWEPDWEDVTIKYCIHCHSNEVQPTCVVSNSKPLSFPTKEARDAFLEVFKDLLEEAKMFI